jgi:hypothetical protein
LDFKRRSGLILDKLEDSDYLAAIQCTALERYAPQKIDQGSESHFIEDERDIDRKWEFGEQSLQEEGVRALIARPAEQVTEPEFGLRRNRNVHREAEQEKLRSWEPERRQPDREQLRVLAIQLVDTKDEDCGLRGGGRIGSWWERCTACFGSKGRGRRAIVPLAEKYARQTGDEADQ